MSKKSIAEEYKNYVESEGVTSYQKLVDLEKELYGAKEENPSKALEVIQGINDIVEERVKDFVTKFETQIQEKTQLEFDVLKANFETEMVKKENALKGKEKSLESSKKRYDEMYTKVNKELGKYFQEKEAALQEEIKALKLQLEENKEDYLLSVINKIQDYSSYYTSELSVKCKDQWIARTVVVKYDSIARAFKNILRDSKILTN